MKLYTKDGRVSSLNNIVLTRDGMQIINPTEEMVLADGWTEYVPEPYVPQPKLEPYEYEVTAALKTMVQPQLASLSDEEALKVKSLYPSWASKTGEVVDTGEKLYYDDRLYKVRQEHTVQEQYPPSVDTASLYEEIRSTRKSTRPTRVRLKTPSRITTTWSWRKANTTFRTASPTSVRGTRT